MGVWQCEMKKKGRELVGGWTYKKYNQKEERLFEDNSKNIFNFI